MPKENANDKLKKWLEHFDELPELQCAHCGVIFKGSHDCDYELLKQKVEEQRKEIERFKTEFQIKKSIVDEKHRPQKQLESSAILIADLMFAYINKDEDLPHDFETKAFEEGLYFLQEHYNDDKYNLRMFETYLNGMVYED